MTTQAQRGALIELCAGDPAVLGSEVREVNNPRRLSHVMDLAAHRTTMRDLR